MKERGLAVRNPLETAQHALEKSKSMTRHLVQLLIDNIVAFDSNENQRATTLTSVGARKDRMER